jgi:predicted ATPase/DNA-binding SARP family transcriptional activator/DNA-binding CsgD family transcriptional regulator
VLPFLKDCRRPGSSCCLITKETMEENLQEAVRIRLLGGFRVSVGSRTVGNDRWRLKKAKGMVKLLALAESHRMHREQLMDLLWPGYSGSKSQDNNLRQALYSARRALESASAGGASSNGYLRLIEDQVALCPEGPLWVDTEAFEEAATTARRVREPAAYRAAIDLYAGELLPEDRYEEWTEERREALQGTYFSLLLELAVLHEKREEFEGAIGALREAVVAEPTHEEAHVRLMRLYALTGRRQEALLQYERLRKALFEGLGGEEEPGEAGRLLYEEIRAGLSPVIQPPVQEERTTGVVPGDPARHNLPVERTSFVGREEETVEVERLLAMTGLLTLTGAGGSGKTRFALALAKGLARTYEDGVWLVELAPLSDPELVERAVAGVLGVTEQADRPLTDALKDYLSSKKLLLVMDNCEHLVEAAAHLAEALLGSCPKLTVLVTSREPLNVAGELVWRVPSLSIPEDSSGGSPKAVEELARYESVRLFVERARYRQTSFELTPENASAVAEVCRRLEGIPLAIELAAARVGVLGVGQIAGKLKDSLGVLTGGSRTASSRQRTLRGTLEWSYELLGELERDLFGRLSVFWGGWTLEAAEAVGAELGDGIGEEDVLDLLGRLVDKSLVVAEAGGAEGELRYRMLEPIRQYGRAKLEESGEAGEVRSRHAAWSLRLAEEAEPELKGAQQMEWLERLEREHENLRAAMRWLLEGDEVERAVRLAWALWLFWWYRGHYEDGQRFADETLAKGHPLSLSQRAKVAWIRGVTSYGRDSAERAARLCQESVDLFRQAGDETNNLALALMGASVTWLQCGDAERASALLEEATDLHRGTGDSWGISTALAHLGMVELNRGEHAHALRHLEEARTISEKISNGVAGHMAAYNLALLAEAGGDHERAVELHIEGLGFATEVGDMANAAYCLEGLAGVAGARDEPERGARLFGAAEALLETVGGARYVHAQDRVSYEHAVEVLRSELGEEAFGAAWAEGRAMTLEQAIEHALSTEAGPPTRKAPIPEESKTVGGQRPTVLTPREREVAMLVAQEMPNGRIAQELAISEPTVAGHVHKILKKLNLRSRIQIAAWAMEQELLR